MRSADDLVEAGEVGKAYSGGSIRVARVLGLPNELQHGPGEVKAFARLEINGAARASPYLMVI